VLDYFVEDGLHHVGIDQMAFGFDSFLKPAHNLAVSYQLSAISFQHP